MPFSFMNPALVWGSGLVSVPIIIHLLNRRRFRIIEWAAMEWLLLAIKQNKRRITIEQLILLALRCLIILLVVFAVSKMYLHGGAAARQITTVTTDWAVVLDDSFTMGQTSEGATCFDRGKAEVGALLDRIVDSGSKDWFTVLATRRPGLKLPSASKVDEAAADGIRHRLDHMGPSDVKLTPGRMLEQGIEMLSGSPNSSKALVLVSDCRRADWRLDETQQRDLKKLLEDAKGIKTYVIDVGPRSTKDYANVAVVRLEAAEDSLYAGVITDFVATVQNFGPDPVADIEVTFTVTTPAGEARTLPSQPIRKLDPDQKATVTESYKCPAPGSYAIQAAVGQDPLLADNSRHLSVTVNEGTRVLVVDGEWYDDITEWETYALERALRPSKTAVFGVNAEVTKADEFRTEQLQEKSVVFLANVARLPKSDVDALGAFVRDGGGLVIFPGDQVEAGLDHFNSLFAPSGGEGLLPGPLLKPVGDASAAARAGGDFWHFNTRHLNHPLMAGFRGPLSVWLRSARFYRRFDIRLPDDLAAGKTAVVARFDDPAESPAIVEHQLGLGRVVLITSSADAEWNNWPNTDTYPVLMNLLVKDLYSPDTAGQNLGVGATYVLPVDIRRYDSGVTIETPKEIGVLKRKAKEPKGKEIAGKSADERRKMKGRGPVVAIGDKGETTAAGIYKVKLKSRTSEPEASKDLGIEYFAVNLDASKSDLRRPDGAALKAALGRLGVTCGGTANDIWEDAPEERVNLWYALLIALGCCMALESFLGWKFGHHTK